MEHQSQEHQTQLQLPGFFEKNRMLIKGFIIGFLILVMLIPAAMLYNLVSEREHRQDEVVKEISDKWATAQTVVGPVIAIPYLSPVAGKQPEQKMLYVLPEQLSINGKLLPEVRHRSLYEVTLYRSAITMSGIFDPSSIKKIGIDNEDILWGQAQLFIGITDSRGLEDDVQLKWSNTNLVMEAGVPNNNLVKTGLSTPISLTPGQQAGFSINIKIKGSSALYFTPVGKTTEMTLNSPWKNPAFDGQYLPSQPANITDNGFVAHWKILQISRSYPQAWKDNAHFDPSESSFGVKLLQPTDSYSKTQRSVKYAILIISLTFAIFFFVEIFQKRQVHPIQYVLVGIALIVFYSLLLSISEYTGFNTAYLIAVAATVSLIGAYVWSIFKKLQIAAGFMVALGSLYSYIFILIQLQDYALLYGSIGLFVVLAIIMYFSRKVDWYTTRQS